MKHRTFPSDLPPLFCTYCGREIRAGEAYWYLNGAAACKDCLPALAREEFAACRQIRGEEAGQ